MAPVERRHKNAEATTERLRRQVANAAQIEELSRTINNLQLVRQLQPHSSTYHKDT